jgi:hypothetical protein
MRPEMRGNVVDAHPDFLFPRQSAYLRAHGMARFMKLRDAESVDETGSACDKYRPRSGFLTIDTTVIRVPWNMGCSAHNRNVPLITPMH